jgi:hypothetical protein
VSEPITDPIDAEEDAPVANDTERRGNVRLERKAETLYLERMGSAIRSEIMRLEAPQALGARGSQP